MPKRCNVWVVTGSSESCTPGTSSASASEHNQSIPRDPMFAGSRQLPCIRSRTPRPQTLTYLQNRLHLAEVASRSRLDERHVCGHAHLVDVPSCICRDAQEVSMLPRQIQCYTNDAEKAHTRKRVRPTRWIPFTSDDLLILHKGLPVSPGDGG